MENVDLKDYEEKLRIELRLKKEFKDKENSEWSSAIFAAFLFMSLFFMLVKCAGG
jgi:hypothetical protein